MCTYVYVCTYYIDIRQIDYEYMKIARRLLTAETLQHRKHNIVIVAIDRDYSRGLFFLNEVKVSIVSM